MPRKYVKKGGRRVIDAETLSKAIKEVLDGKMTVRSAARAFDINYSSLLFNSSRSTPDESDFLAAKVSGENTVAQ